jgi:hypothetical protein
MYCSKIPFVRTISNSGYRAAGLTALLLAFLTMALIGVYKGEFVGCRPLDMRRRSLDIERCWAAGQPA